MYHSTLTYSVNSPHILYTQMYHSTLTYSVNSPHILYTQTYHSTLSQCTCTVAVKIICFIVRPHNVPYVPSRDELRNDVIAYTHVA